MAVSICDDKSVTMRVVSKAGVQVPEQIDAGAERRDIEAFVARHGSVVVKPARGEQGRGIAVGLADLDQIERPSTMPAPSRTACCWNPASPVKTCDS